MSGSVPAPGSAAPGTRPERRARADATLLLGLAAIVAGAAVLRIVQLNGQGIWNDEASSLLWGRLPVGDIIVGLGRKVPGLPLELNPPLYFLLLHTWFGLFGDGPAQARAFSAMAGVSAVPLMYVAGRSLFDRRTGIIAALLLSVSQVAVWASQEARPYALLMALFIATLIAFDVARKGGRLDAWCAATVLAIVTVYTHYHAVFAVAILAVFAIWSKPAIPTRRLLASLGVATLCLAPWLAYALPIRLRGAVFDVLSPYFVTSRWTVLTVLNRFANGAVHGLLNPAPRWTFLVGGLLFGGPLATALFRRLLRSNLVPPADPTWLLAALAIVPTVVLVASGTLFNLQFDARYVAYSAVPMYLLVASTCARLERRPMILLTTALVAYSALALRAHYTVPSKEDYRDAVALVDQQHAAGDCFAFVPFGTPPLSWPIYTQWSPTPVLSLTGPMPAEVGCRRVWMITYERWQVPDHERWQQWTATALTEYDLRQTRPFFWVSVQLFERRPRSTTSGPP